MVTEWVLFIWMTAAGGGSTMAPARVGGPTTIQNLVDLDECKRVEKTIRTMYSETQVKTMCLEIVSKR